MLRSHHHLRGFIQTSLLCEWMLVYPVGYVGVGFEWKLWLQVWYLVCSYVGGWLCRLFWHLLLIFGASVPGGGWSASGVFTMIFVCLICQKIGILPGCIWRMIILFCFSQVSVNKSCTISSLYSQEFLRHLNKIITYEFRLLEPLYS